MSSHGMRMWRRHAAWRRVACARVAPQRGKSSHALTTTTTTTTGVCDALDTTVGLGADTLARSLEQRHMVQRLLRRLPVGTSSTLLYLNELPSMLKTGLVRLALTTRREQQQQQQQQQQQGVTASAADTRTLLRLRAPHASVSDAALTSMAAAYRVRPRTTTTASWQQQQRTVQALPSSCARDVDDGVANGDDVCDVQAPVLLVPQTQQRHECTLGVCVSASPLMSSSSSSSLCVTSASSALRVDYRHTPQLYILGLPAALVRDAVREHDDDNSSSDGSSDVACRDEVVAQLLRRWLVYDEDTQQLMLLLPRRRRHGRHWHRCAPHAFLAQTYAFSPHDAFAAAVAAAAVERSDDNNNDDDDAVTSCDYRLFFLVAATDDVGVAATTTAATTTAGAAVASSSSSVAAGVALRDVGALYPSSFTTVAVDVPVTSLSSSLSSSPPLSRRAGVAWTPLSMKRLRYRGGGVDDGSDSSGHAPAAHLWGGQLVDLGVAHTSTVAAAMPTLRPHTRSGIAGRPGSSNATATATTSMVLQEREWLQLAERSFAASRAALLQRSAQRTLQHDDDDDKDKCSRTETDAHGRRSDAAAAAAAAVDDGHDVVHAMTTPYDTHTHTSADAATMTTLSAARVRHVRFTAAVAMPVAPAPLRADAASPLAAALHRALYRYKHELYTRLQQLATRTATATTAAEGQQQQQHSAANVSPPPSSLLTTALDDAMVARERVLLPFLRQPRQLPLSFVDDTHHCRAQEMHNNDNDDSENSNSNSSNDETSRTRTRRGGAVAAADFVPVLWQMRELEAVTGWRRYGAWFAQRYGALRDVVSADMLVTLGDGAHNAYARRHDDDADERRAGVCATATTATMTTCIERAYYPAQPFVLLHDDVYVQRVLLPALRRYAHALHTHTSKTRVRHDNNNNNNNSDDDDEGVQARVPLSVRKACRRHGMCLQTWLQSLRALDAHARTNALRLRGHIDARDTTVTRTAAHVPAALRALLAAALQQQQEQQQQQQQQSSTASSPTVRFVAVPIAPFLEWATLPPCCRHRRRRGGGRVRVFSHADVVRFVQYALCYAAHMDVTAGDGTTVAFVVASADDRGATRS